MARYNRRNGQARSVDQDSAARQSPASAAKPTSYPSKQQCLYVGNLPLGATPEEIERVFRKFGPIKSISIQPAKQWYSHTYGFVVFNARQSATACLRSCQKIRFRDKTLIVGRKQKLRGKRTDRVSDGANFGPCGARPSNFSSFEHLSDNSAKTLTPLGSISNAYQSENDEAPSQLFSPLLSSAFAPTPVSDSTLEQDEHRGTVIIRRDLRPISPVALLFNQQEPLPSPKANNGLGIWCNQSNGSTLVETSECHSDNMKPEASPGTKAVGDIPHLAPVHSVLRVGKIPYAWTAASLFNNIKFLCGDALRATLVYDDHDQNLLKEGLVEVDNQFTAASLQEWAQVAANGTHLKFYQSEVKSIASVCRSYQGKYTSYLAPEDTNEIWVHPSVDEMSPLFTPLTADGETPETLIDSPQHMIKEPCFETSALESEEPERMPLAGPCQAKDVHVQSKLARTVLISGLAILDGGTYLHVLAAKYGTVKRVDVCLDRTRAYVSFETNEEATKAAGGFNGVRIGENKCIAELA